MTDHASMLLKGLQEIVEYRRGERKLKTTRVFVDTPDARAIRMMLGLSQQDFADAFGISVKTIRNWESGRRQPDGPARILLRMIKNHPTIVANAVHRSKK